MYTIKKQYNLLVKSGTKSKRVKTTNTDRLYIYISIIDLKKKAIQIKTKSDQDYHNCGASQY